MSTIHIDENEPSSFPSWYYMTKESPTYSLGMLLSDGIVHTFSEIKGMFSDFFINDINKIVSIMNDADCLITEKEGKPGIAARLLSPSQVRFGECVDRIIEMYKLSDTHSYQEIYEEIVEILPSDRSVGEVIDDVRLILYLRKLGSVDDTWKHIAVSPVDTCDFTGLERIAKWREFGQKKYSIVASLEPIKIEQTGDYFLSISIQQSEI